MKLIKTKKRCNGFPVYKYKDYIIKHEAGKKPHWDIINKDNEIEDCGYGLKRVKVLLEVLIEKKIKKEKGAGWRCPNGCKIDTVCVDFSETVQGYVSFDCMDKDLDEEIDRVEENACDYQTYDSTLCCPKCKAECTWSEGTNSIEFINKE